MPKRWSLRSKVPPELVERFPEIDPILLQLLVGRGLIEQAAIDSFLEPDYSRDLADPGRFRSMDRAVDRIIRALRERERLTVYGDYDADGVCASAVLSETFRALGAEVDVYIPYRDAEGYGLNLPAVEEIARSGTKLMVTVDCGSGNVAEVERAHELGLDVIVTDHHDEPPAVAPAYAMLNPALAAETYPFRYLSAAGVAFTLVRGLLARTRSGAELGHPLPTGWEKWLLDLVAIATVADMVPLLGENRVLVRFGLAVLQKTRRVGLRALFETVRTDLSQADETTLGFQVGPRLNAAGRLQHASTAYRLLVTEDPAEAATLAQQLSTTNLERQRLTEAAVTEAVASIGESPRDLLVVAQRPTWPTGILGLIAGKMVERYGRPAIAMGVSSGRTVGSGRSVPAFDITAALATTRALLDRFGGHPQACGFTLRAGVEPATFAQAIVNAANEQLRKVDLRPELTIDAEVVLDDISWKLVEDVARLAPFGIEAEEPRFLSRGLRIVRIDTVGKDGKHLRLHVTHATSRVHKTIGFRFGAMADRLAVGDTIDLVFHVGVNEWNGSREIELKMVDVDHAQP